MDPGPTLCFLWGDPPRVRHRVSRVVGQIAGVGSCIVQVGRCSLSRINEKCIGCYVSVAVGVAEDANRNGWMIECFRNAMVEWPRKGTACGRQSQSIEQWIALEDPKIG